MELRKLIERSIRRKGARGQVAAEVNAAIAANIGESGQHTHVSKHQRVVQRSGKTVVSESEAKTTGGRDEQ